MRTICEEKSSFTGSFRRVTSKLQEQNGARGLSQWGGLGFEGGMYDPTHSYLGLDVDFSGSVILRKTDYVMTFSSYTLKVMSYGISPSPTCSNCLLQSKEVIAPSNLEPTF